MTRATAHSCASSALTSSTSLRAGGGGALGKQKGGSIAARPKGAHVLTARSAALALRSTTLGPATPRFIAAGAGLFIELGSSILGITHDAHDRN
jgi:hypothetical protein